MLKVAACFVLALGQTPLFSEPLERSYNFSSAAGQLQNASPGQIVEPPVVGQDVQVVDFEASFKSLPREAQVYLLDLAKGVMAGPDLPSQKIMNFVWNYKFVAPHVKDKDSRSGKAIQVRLGREVLEWVSERPVRAAVLKTVFESKKSLNKLSLEENLIGAMSDWEKDAGKTAMIEKKQMRMGPLGLENQKEWLEGFLAFAAARALDVLKAAEAVPGLARPKPTPPPKPQTPDKRKAPKKSPKSSPGTFSRQKYGIEDLYGKFGKEYDAPYKKREDGKWETRKVANVFDLDGRKISIRINTEKRNMLGMSDPANLEELISIFDITNPNDVYGRNFNLDYKGGAFPLNPAKDDPKSDERSRRYALELKPEGNDLRIVFSRDLKKESKFSILLSDLYKIRALQAIENNDVIEIHKEKFFILPQGGVGRRPLGDNKELVLGAGALLFMPLSIKDDLWNEHSHPGNLRPKALAYTTQRTSRGTEVFPESKLGRIGPRKDDVWKLQYDKLAGLFLVEADVPDSPDKKEAGGTDLWTAIGDKFPSQDQYKKKMQKDPDGAVRKDLEEVEKINAALAERKANFKVYVDVAQPAGSKKWFFVKESSPGQKSEPVSVGFVSDQEPDAANYKIYFAEAGSEAFVVAENSKGKIFYPLEGKKVGVCSPKEGVITNDKNLLPTLLECAGFPSEAIGTAKGNLGKVLKGREPIQITGNLKGGLQVSIQGEKEGIRFWPKLDAQVLVPVPSSDPAHPSQKVSRFDLAGVEMSQFKGFARMLHDQQRGTLTKDPALSNHSAAVYVDRERQNWYLRIQIKQTDPKEIFITGLHRIFSVSEEAGRRPPPRNFQAQGLQVHKLKSTLAANFRPVPAFAGREEKGAIALYDVAPGNNKKSGCLGVVLWWGTNLQEAESACRN